MSLPPALRKAALTAHVVASVGWIGAATAYLALAVAAQTGQGAGIHRAMTVTAWYVIVPLAFGSLVTGLISALGSPWGLLRHYWVIFKLVLNVLATVVLLGYVQSLDSVGAHPTHVIHAAGGLLVLLVATVLAIYKPRGLTPYGQRLTRPAGG